ncbi:VOC family protein [Haladaptatus sp. DJG-WS-42]|uniref:VOC family protein n=1 Tax=Haladaptatus sp. DJG-WS-42 TaxID=3120516 RepID=UPI0030CBC8C4
MSGAQKLEHATLRVTNLPEAVVFYTDVMGLVELSRLDGRVYLGTGIDEHYDLAVEEGGTGVEHFAIRVSDESVLDDYAERLVARGISTARHDGTEPGQDAGLRFTLPSGVSMEFVVVPKRRYAHVTEGGASKTDCGPVDLDHITLATSSPKRDAEFLRDALGFRISDAAEQPSGEWGLAFTRFGAYHHDVGLIQSDNDAWNLFHLAWTFSSFDHMKLFADNLARHGYPLEMGMNRHYFGDNLFAYFREPGGNRFEITAEMATVDEDTPTYIHTAASERENVVAAWGGIALPESMKEGM